MYSRLTGLLLLILLLLLAGLPLAAQETMAVRPGEAAPAFTCAEEDCERLAWLPAGARVAVIGQVEGRELEGSPQWYDVLLDCPCFDYESHSLNELPDIKGPEPNIWHPWQPFWAPDSARIATIVGSGLHLVGCCQRRTPGAGAAGPLLSVPHGLVTRWHAYRCRRGRSIRGGQRAPLRARAQLADRGRRRTLPCAPDRAGQGSLACSLVA